MTSGKVSVVGVGKKVLSPAELREKLLQGNDAVAGAAPVASGERRGPATKSAPAAADAAPARRKPILSFGALRSEITLTVHTRAAIQVWMGRRPSDGTPGGYIMGVGRFAAICRDMEKSSELDDPWADLYFIKTEEALEQAKQRIAQLARQLEALIQDQVPEELNIGAALSQAPQEIELRVKSFLAFRAVYLLTDLDRLARQALLAQHVGVIGRRAGAQIIHEAQKHFRLALRIAADWVFTGVNRDDCAARNQRARDAAEKMGAVPEDILSGERRSPNAPDIRTLGQVDSDSTLDDATTL